MDGRQVRAVAIEKRRAKPPDHLSDFEACFPGGAGSGGTPGGRVAGAATFPGSETLRATGRDAHGCRSASSSGRHVPGSSGSSTG